MLKRASFIILLALLTTVFTLTWIKVASKDVTLMGNVKNAYSKQWVYGAKITIEVEEPHFGKHSDDNLFEFP